MATENERVVSEFCKTWETLNIDKVMEFFTDDAVYHNIPLAAATGQSRDSQDYRRFHARDHEDRVQDSLHGVGGRDGVQ